MTELAELVAGYGFAYLVTVGADGRPRTTTVVPTFAAGRFDVGPVGRHRRADLSHRADVTLIWPPQLVTDYSLIVDGQAELPSDAADSVRVTPMRALLHRPVFADNDGSVTTGRSDCVDVTGF